MPQKIWLLKQRYHDRRVFDKQRDEFLGKSHKRVANFLKQVQDKSLCSKLMKITFFPST